MAAEDVERLIDLWEVVAAEGRWIGREAVDRAAMRDEYARWLADEDSLEIAAVLDGEVVGTLGVEVDPSGVAHLGMFLAPEARGQGLGSALLTECIAWTRGRPDCHKLTLQHWPHNAAAHALYRRHGFVVEGYLHRHWRRRNGELWDAVVMGLDVES